MKIENKHAYEHTPVDAAYVNSLVELVNACRAQAVTINTVYAYQNGWCVTFEGYEGDAICHDGSYGSPCPYWRGDQHLNDWNASGAWETIGFPWDGDDVSTHDAAELAFYIHCLDCGVAPWETDEDEDNIPDDVDETNYDPYAGCDVYDTIDLDSWSDY